MTAASPPLALSSEFIVSAQRYLAWCKNSALPYWAEKSLDDQGGFYERLLFDGTPDLQAKRRVLVQARQVYVYSHAHYLGWFDGADKIARHGFSFLTRQGMQTDKDPSHQGSSGCARLLNPDGTLADGARDTYTQAFLILACAWYVQAFDSARARTVLNDTVQFLEKNLSAEHGGYFESLPPRLPRRQNPHMHLFEAYLITHMLTDDISHLNKAQDIYHLFTEHFFDKAAGSIVREFFTADWSIDERKGAIIEPGHMMEWCWLLGLYAEATGEDVSQYQDPLHHRAIELGLDTTSGFLADEVCLKTGQVSNTRRSWPQTEYIKSCLTLARRSKEEHYLRQATELLNRLIDTYLAVPQPGGWRDCYRSDGTPFDDFMQTSTFYHFFGLAAEVDKTLGSVQRAPNGPTSI